LLLTQLERLVDRRAIGLRRDGARFVGPAHHLRHNNCGEQAEDDDDDHYLDEREASGARRGSLHHGKSFFCSIFDR
jgi:hypothetical protein